MKQEIILVFFIQILQKLMKVVTIFMLMEMFMLYQIVAILFQQMNFFGIIGIK